MKEIWKPLPWVYKPVVYDYDEPNQVLIEISNLGRVRSFVYKATRIVPQYVNTSWYSYFQFNIQGKRYTYTTHKAVMLAFVWERPTNQEINHINSNKQDNRLVNLEYCTHKENIQHSFKKGTHKAIKGADHHFYHKTGLSHPKSKPVVQFDLKWNKIKIWDSMNLIETTTNRKWKRSFICRSIKQNTLAYWYKWKYYDTK